MYGVIPSVWRAIASLTSCPYVTTITPFVTFT